MGPCSSGPHLAQPEPVSLGRTTTTDLCSRFRFPGPSDLGGGFLSSPWAPSTVASSQRPGAHESSQACDRCSLVFSSKRGLDVVQEVGCGFPGLLGRCLMGAFVVLVLNRGYVDCLKTGVGWLRGGPFSGRCCVEPLMRSTGLETSRKPLPTGWSWTDPGGSGQGKSRYKVSGVRLVSAGLGSAWCD